MNTNVKLDIKNVLIYRESENKFLGVILKLEFCWKPPYFKRGHLCNRMAKTVGILGKTEYFGGNSYIFIYVFC